jgi:hypothetical protein
MSILEKFPFIAQTRRHHALEHATIQVLNNRFPTLHLVGWSTHRGFYIHGHVSTADVQNAVAEALARLRRGESYLAIHPRCGTNLVTTGTLVGLIAFLTMLPGDRRSRRERLPLVLLLSTLGALFAQPLGMLVQEHITTDPSMDGAITVEIESSSIGDVPLHMVRLS